MNFRILPYGIFFSLLLCCLPFGVAAKPAGNAMVTSVKIQSDSIGSAVFIKARPGKEKVFKGEPVTVSYLLYHSIPVIDPQQEIAVKFEDCFTEEFPAREVFRNEQVNGKKYQVALLKKLLIIPQNQGMVKIPAISQTFKMNAPPDPNDFFGVERVISTKVNSEALKLKVTELPPVPDSLTFSGAIGKFTVESKYSVDIKHPNLLTCNLRITGIGNLKAANIIAPVLPAGTEKFNEKSGNTHELAKDGLKAEFWYSFQVMAGFRGIYTLPAISFVYFDPEKAIYVILKTEPYKWEVTEGPLPPVATKTKPETDSSRGLVLFSKSTLGASNHSVFQASGQLPLVLIMLSGMFLAAGLVIADKNRKVALDPAKYHSRKAYKRAMASIKALRKAAGNNMERDLFSQGLVLLTKQYLSAKCYASVKEINPDTIPTILRERNIPETEIADVISFFNQQYALRFSRSNYFPQTQKEQLQTVEALVNKLESYFNGKAGT